jgi:hypothetical protein
MRLGKTTALAIAALVAATAAADARCTRLGFSVTDYGKDGPTADAKKLLDQHIARWGQENGIKRYVVGKKDVKCELYLDLIVFDEYTCRAEATVCWGDRIPAGGAAPAAPTQTGPAPEKKPAAPKATAG